jgi:putative salt-induced outer membrane protein YdiY
MRTTRVPRHPISAAAATGLALVLGAGAAFAQAPAGPPPTWTGSAGGGVAVTGGNSDTMNFNVGFDVTRTPMARNVIKMTGLHLRGDQNDEAVVDRTSLGFRNEYTISPRTFVFGQLDYLHDTFKLIDYLVAPTVGLGYKVINTDPTKFSIDAGVGSVSEKNPDVDLRTSAAITAGEKLTHQLTSTASIKHAITGLWKADDFDDGLYTFSIGLATQISPRVQLSIELLDTFKNKPPTVTTKKNDVALVTAITSKF